MEKFQNSIVCYTCLKKYKNEEKSYTKNIKAVECEYLILSQTAQMRSEDSQALFEIFHCRQEGIYFNI